MDASKIEETFFLEYQWMSLNEWSKYRQRYLDNLACFQMAFKMRRKIIRLKEMTNIDGSEIKQERNI